MRRQCRLIFIFVFAVLVLLPVDGIILDNCSRYITISKLFLPSKDIDNFKKGSTEIQASDWKSCFLSCCYLSSCREVVYGVRTGCLHVECSGPFGFCKYRPNELMDVSIHGIIIRERRLDIPLSEQLDQLQFRNGPSLVTSDMRFTHVQQCAQYVEPVNVTGVAESWATKRFSPFSYLYGIPRAVPPLGMRSAVPLGGLGTGSFELRADGSFTEWTLENQSPGGSAKLSQGALDLAFIGVRVQTAKGVKASLLRTHPAHGLPSVDGLSYSGAFPVSKLVVEDKGFFGVQMDLYAYGSLRARNATASALPAVFFTLRVRNPTTNSANVSLLLNLPLGEQPDTSREGHAFKVVKDVSTSSICAELCQEHLRCKAWSLENGSCELKDIMPLHAYKRATTSGVKGFWGSSHDRLTCGRPGRYPNSGSTTIMLVKKDKNDNKYRRDSVYENHEDSNNSNNSKEGRYGNTGNEVTQHNSSNKKRHDGDNMVNTQRKYYKSDKRRKKNNSKNDKDKDSSNNNKNDKDKDSSNNNNKNGKNNSGNTNNNVERENTHGAHKETNNKDEYESENIQKKKLNTKKSKKGKTNIEDITFSSAVSNDINDIWKHFEKYGHLHNMVVKDTGFHGSGVGRMILRPGEEATITLVMAWYYPFRDHAGEIVGQYYGNIFKSSEEVASHARQNIKNVLSELISYRENMMPPRAPNWDPQEIFHIDSSLPDWLQDMLVNSLSYWRTGFWVADGRWRQWETFDCNDVDSVHNDFQRELPYVLFFPGLLENVVRAWAKSQLPNGIIPEALQGQFGCWAKTNKLDAVGGRLNMADVHPAFIAQVYHLYIWAGKEQLLRDLWPTVRKATQWMIDEGTDGTGLPLRMTNTYDILQLQQYDHSFYNSVMFLLGLRAAEEIAEVQKDVDMYFLIREAIAKALKKVDQLFWDDERGYYHAWWDSKKGSPPWMMADSLYGQVWAYTLGLGNLLDPEKMKSHMNKENLLNDTPYGLRVMTNNRANKEDDTNKTRRKRDVTEEQKRILEFNQYYENLNQNSYRPTSEDLSYGTEDYQRTLNSINNGYGRTMHIYQNSQSPNVYPVYQYQDGYAVDQRRGFRAMTDWDKYYHYMEEENRPSMNEYLSTSGSPVRGEKESVALQYENLESVSSTNLERNLYASYVFSNDAKDSNKELPSRKVKVKEDEEYDSSSPRNIIKTAATQKHAEGKPFQKPNNSSNCSLLRKHSIYKSIWMGASPDWTSMQIHLGIDPYKALEQTKKSLLHYRDHLNDLWNIHGLTAGSGYGLDGQPWCTSHYTFHMVLWHIPFALSGQQYSIIERSLVFNPRVKVPYALPFFLPYASGTIEAVYSPNRRAVLFKVSVTHGYLILKSLVISGTVWPGKVLKLEKGEFVIWS
ncbi:uncharacterized protein LOC116288065 [Actinia tenebrosa]|uniref:Uncharacterized protein LOC116288065 n=1 Tax=Actinia tenebrosa TaxID=6105 RepID=A0A6P8HD63_ACTTE|nr:uncharacterized protein LOC116288065 [Actinia tenebrosa]